MNLVSVSKYNSVIKTVLEETKTGITFSIINVYGPFHERREFWGTLFSLYAVEVTNVILGGDLNLTLTMVELWGENARNDSRSIFYFIFLGKGLIDVQPLKLDLTWRNK